MPTKPTRPSTQNKPRRRGRPPKLKAADILQHTMALLETRGADEISMADVAARLETPVMSLYYHFPNTTVLLQAVADHSFEQFRAPRVRRGQAWQSQLLAWLRAVAQHCERYPVALRIFSIEGQTSPAWRRVLLPAQRLVQGLGMDDATTALTLSWLTSQIFGLIYIEEFAHPARQLFREMEGLEPQDAACETLLAEQLPKLQKREVLELGCQAIVDGLERHLARQQH